jgi:xanthine dehydrogenase YagR molybdenum-binding subunit
VVTTNTDVPALGVHFVEYPDYNLNTLGARGVGEIGLAGAAAALTNASITLPESGCASCR